VSQLLEKAKNQEVERRKAEVAKLKESAAKLAPQEPATIGQSSTTFVTREANRRDTSKERKDAPPYRVSVNFFRDRRD